VNVLCLHLATPEKQISFTSSEEGGKREEKRDQVATPSLSTKGSCIALGEERVECQLNPKS